MKLNKHTIKTKKREGLCYQLPNFRFENSSHSLKWDAFRFFSPLGPIWDEDGTRFFNVMGNEIPIKRDNSLNKELVITFSVDRGTEILEYLDGATNLVPVTDFSTDIAVKCFIPCDLNKEIIVDYKEVTWD